MLPIVAVFVMLATPADGAPLACPKEPGFIGGPLVPTADAAKGIFAVVSQAILPGQPRDKYVLVATDNGTTWSVSQGLRPPNDKNTFGGGGLTMQIDKCTGAISEVHAIR